jgi:hypothetical protein
MSREIDKMMMELSSARNAVSGSSFGASAFDRLRDQALGLDSVGIRAALGLDRSSALERALARLTATSLSSELELPSGVKDAIERATRPLFADRSVSAFLTPSPLDDRIEHVRSEAEGFGARAMIPHSLLTASEQFKSMFHRPGFDETSELARQIATSRMFRGQVTSLADQINGPWARTGSELASMAQIGQLRALSHAAVGPQPFGRPATSLFRDELGDWRGSFSPGLDLLDPVARRDLYIGRGYDTGLTDFPEEVVEQLIEIVSEDSDTSAADEGEDRADRAFAALSRFERRVRDFIVATLQAEFGERWEAQIPQDILKLWHEKHQRDVDLARAPRPRLIDYADFTEYTRIIRRKDNWKRAFRSVFKREEDVVESFTRIMPVRLVTMHSAPVLPDDEVLLTFEIRRLLNAIARASC